MSILNLRCLLGRHDWRTWHPWRGHQIRWCSRCAAFELKEDQ